MAGENVDTIDVLRMLGIAGHNVMLPVEIPLEEVARLMNGSSAKVKIGTEHYYMLLSKNGAPLETPPAHKPPAQQNPKRQNKTRQALFLAKTLVHDHGILTTNNLRTALRNELKFDKKSAANYCCITINALKKDTDYEVFQDGKAQVVQLKKKPTEKEKERLAQLKDDLNNERKSANIEARIDHRR